jgi:SAM-dependent methyltransferase
MIERARENAKTSGLRIDFFCTDAGELPFDDGAFDVVISRNVIWALTNPEEALCQWRRVLKSGGLLIYFDGNHYYYLFNDEARKARELYTALTGSPYRDDTGTVDYSEMEKAALELPLSKFDRPHGWDERVLPQLGYEIVAEETEHPQDFLKDGVPEGYYTSFMMIAKKLPDGGR